MYIPLNVNTHYSLMRGYGKPEPLLKECANFDYKTCAIADYDVLSGSVDFYKEAIENNIKPIIGTKIKIHNGPESGYVTLYAMNEKGWKSLIYLSSSSYLNPEPCLMINQILDEENLIAIIGDYKSLKDKNSFELLRDSYKDRFFYGVVPGEEAPSGVKTVHYNQIMYVNPQEKWEQLLLRSSDLGIKFSDWSGEKDEEFQRYYKGNFYLPPNLYTKDINDSSFREIDEMCESYSLLGKPNLPKYNCPNNLSESEYLLELSRDGWKKRFSGTKLLNQKQYVDRIQKELAVIQKAGLEGYFLIVQNYVNWARERMLVGPGRGSAAGSLLSYLLGITNVDPIPYGLMFERFYNDGRNTADKVALPDIDIDFPPNRREEVINHIRNFVGMDKSCQVITFSSLQGRGALKEVLRVYNVCDNKKMDEITKRLPPPDKISDKMEEDKETSVIRWTLKNEPKSLQDFCSINDKDELVGPYSQYFDYAIQLESTYKSYGKHASALVVSGSDLMKTCPMVREKNGNELIGGLEFTKLEEMGLAKLDILGLAALQKLESVKYLLKNGTINNE